MCPFCKNFISHDNIFNWFLFQSQKCEYHKSGEIVKNAKFSWNFGIFCNFSNFEVLALLGLLRNIIGIKKSSERWDLTSLGVRWLRKLGRRNVIYVPICILQITHRVVIWKINYRRIVFRQINDLGISISKGVVSTKGGIHLRASGVVG